jgi:regulatory LuxR family protein
VLALLADGRRSNETARELRIGPKTVASHVQRVTAKLRAHSRAEAFAIAYKEGLITRRTTSPETDFEGMMSVASSWVAPSNRI